MSDSDALAADLLERAGNLVSGLAVAFGDRGTLAGTAVKAITHTAAQAIRHRGASVDEIVQALKKVGKLRTPWGGDGKVTGKDPK